MLFRFVPISVFIALFLLPACRRAPSAAEPELLRVQTRKFERLLPGCGDKSKREEPCVSFRVQWPEVVHAVSPDVQARINSAVQSRLQPAEAPHGFEAEADQTIEEYQRFHKEFPDSAISYFTRREAEVIFLNPSLLSIQIESEEFRGGAHPNSGREYLNLRPKTGEEVALKELIQDGSMPQLLAAVEKHFRAVRSIDTEQSLSVAGFTFPENRFELPKTWGISTHGLVFHYNAYEVAPYAMGPTTVEVPWPDLKGIVRPGEALLPMKRTGVQATGAPTS